MDEKKLREFGRQMRKSAFDFSEFGGNALALALALPVGVGAAGGYMANEMINEPGPEEYARLRREEKVRLLKNLAARSRQRRRELMADDGID